MRDIYILIGFIILIILGCYLSIQFLYIDKFTKSLILIVSTIFTTLLLIYLMVRINKHIKRYLGLK